MGAIFGIAAYVIFRIILRVLFFIFFNTDKKGDEIYYG